MKRLFGTDGIRGVAGEPPLDAQTIFAAGRAVGEHLQGEGARGHTGQVLLGADTRESSPWVESLLAGGLEAAKVDSISAGVIPTPGLAYLVRAKKFAAGLMVSASHNPYRDNGIKLIGATGQKLPDELESRIEERIHGLLGDGVKPRELTPPVDTELGKQYQRLLRQAVGKLDLAGLHLVVDCAHGAASHIGPGLFQGLGAIVSALHAAPDGRNINEGCGALHPEVVAGRVKELGADAGVAFDGDADRAMLATASGQVFDGDCILLAAGRWMKKQGTLKGNCVVGTVMANLGLEVALRDAGIELARTKVGDRYVLKEMQQRGANLGGEQSGHVIFLDHAPTGDGLLTALEMLSIVRQSGRTLEELVQDLRVFPQTLQNVPVREKPPLEQVAGLQEAIGEAKAALGDRGRVVVRYSGTEKLLRVMVEAEEEAQVAQWSAHIVSSVQRELGP